MSVSSSGRRGRRELYPVFGRRCMWECSMTNSAQVTVRARSRKARRMRRSMPWSSRVDAFRRGRPVIIARRGAARCSRYAAETLTDGALWRCRRRRARVLVLTPCARAHAEDPALHARRRGAGGAARASIAARLRAIADPTDDLAFPLKGPFDAECARLARRLMRAAVKLAKLAGLLPAVVVQRARDAPKGAVDARRGGHPRL